MRVTTRISLRSMLIGVAIVAIACGSVTRSSLGLAMLFKAIVAVSFLVAALAVAYRRGGRQAAWLGFAVFGISASLLIWQFPSTFGTQQTIASLAHPRYREFVVKDPTKIQFDLWRQVDAIQEDLDQLERFSDCRSGLFAVWTRKT